MGYASSNAVRRDDAYGSLGGSFGGTERKLKKKPVLVLDPEELAKAHHLFQIGAAEQLGEFDPRNRVSVPAAAVFGSILGVVRFDDEEDDYIAPSDMAPVDLADDEEEPEDDLPPIDLQALLALTQAEQEEEDEYQRYQAAASLAFEAEQEREAAQPPMLVEQTDAAEIAPAPAADPNAATRSADASTADALARILSRAAARTQPSPLLADLDLSKFGPVEADVTEAEEVMPPEPEVLAADQPADDLQWLAPVPADAPEPVRDAETEFSDNSWPPIENPEDDVEPFDLSLEDKFDGEDLMRNDASPRLMPVIGEEGVRSTLRARLVREETPIIEPELTAWRKFANALRSFWQRFS